MTISESTGIEQRLDARLKKRQPDESPRNLQEYGIEQPEAFSYFWGMLGPVGLQSEQPRSLILIGHGYFTASHSGRLSRSDEAALETCRVSLTASHDMARAAFSMHDQNGDGAGILNIFG